MSSSFWQGFEKRAGNPLVGAMPGIKSGIKGIQQGGKMMAAKPSSGISIAARSTAPALPTPMPTAAAVKMPKVTLPKQSGRGTSSMTI